MLGYVDIENKVNLTFYRVSNIGLGKFGVKELIYKFVTSAVFLVTYTDKRNTGKALYALLF